MASVLCCTFEILSHERERATYDLTEECTCPVWSSIVTLLSVLSYIVSRLDYEIFQIQFS